MDFLKSLASEGGDKPSQGGDDKKIGKHSSSELLASAKTVADAAKTAAAGGMEKVDKEKAAGAASDLLDAGSDYGKLAEKGYGKYVDQAQDYLHQFGGKPAASTPAPAPAPAADPPKPAAEEEKPAAAPPAEHNGDDEKKKSEEKSDGGGIGGFVKTAQGFF